MAFTKSIDELINEDTSGLLAKHESWERVLVSDIAEVINGCAFKSSFFNSSGDGLPLIRIRDIVSGVTETFYNGPFEKEYIVRNGDFLIGMDGDFNCGFWRGDEALLNQRVCKVKLKSKHYNMKLISYLMPHYLNAINRQTSSMTVKHLSSKTVNNILLPLPPEKEQVRIVEKLEELLSDLENGVAELKAAQAKLDQYSQSILKSAVDGSLTEQWRKDNTCKINENGEQLLIRILKERRAHWEVQKEVEFKAKEKKPPTNWKEKYPIPVSPDINHLPELPEGWVWATVDQLSVTKKYGSSSKTSDDSTGVPVLRMGNIQDGELDYRNLKYLPQDHKDFPSLFLDDGDLLFNRTNSAELVGKTAVYRDIGKPCSFASYIISVTFCDGYLPEMAAYFINSVVGKAWIARVMSQTAGQANVNGTKLGGLAIPLPPIKEQEQIVEMVVSIRDEVKSQLNAITKGIFQSEVQRKNILKDAFLGKLVPQDSNDEPASLLLKKIRKERAEHAKKTKPMPKPRGKKVAMNKASIDSVRDWIDKQEDKFTFEQLSQAFNSEYEMLQGIIFSLLDEEPAVIEQVFDKDIKCILFIKVGK